MSRVQVPTINRLTPITPQATPVDALVHPMQPTQVIGPSKAEQLAEALGGLAPNVNKVLVDHQNTVDQQAADQGTLARDLRGKASVNFKDAVNKNIIPLSANPFFQAAYKERDGAIAADQYKSDLIVALSVGPFAASKDPSETEPLLNTFRDSWLKDHPDVSLNDPHFSHGFDSAVQQTNSNVREHQANEIGKRQEADAYNNNYHDVLSIYDDAQLRNLPPTSVAAAISHTLDLGISVGMDPKTLNGIVLDAARAKSLETGTTEPFLALDSVQTGKGFLGRTINVINAKHEIEDMLATQKRSEDDHAWVQAQRDRTVTEQNANKTIFDNLFASEQSGTPANIMNVSQAFKTLGDVNPNQAESMQAMFTAFNKNKADTDDELTKWTLYNEGGLEGTLNQSRVNKAFSASLLTATTAKDLTDRITARTQRDLGNARADAAEARAAEPKTFDQIDAYQEGRASLKKILGDDPLATLSPEVAKRIAKANFMFSQASESWVQAHPNATPQEQIKNSSENLTSILSLVDPDGSIAKSNAATGQYNYSPSTPLPQLLQATSPTNPNVPTSRLFPNSVAWAAAKDEFEQALRKGKIDDTEMVKLAKQYNIPLADLGSFIDGQDALYTTVTPTAPVATGAQGKKK